MNQEKLIKSLSYIIWGYVLIHFSINIQTIDILPEWIGYFLLLQTITVLSHYDPSISLLKPFAIGLVIYTLCDWVFTIFGIAFDVYILHLLIQIISLYFHFQFLTNLANIATQFSYNKTHHILLLRTIRTVFITLFSLPIDWNTYQSIALIVLLANVLVILFTWITLLDFKKYINTNA